MVHAFVPRGEHNLTRCEFKFARKNNILSKLKTIFSFTFFEVVKYVKSESCIQKISSEFSVNQKRIGSYKNKMEMKIKVKLSNMKKAK